MKRFTIIFVAVCALSSCTQQQSPELKESIERGRFVYEDLCVTCHLPSGEGVPKAFPPLAQSDYLMERRMESIKAIKFGQQGKIIVNDIEYNGVMTNQGLTDEEVADVMNYILNSWGNSDNKMVTVKEVSAVKK